MDTLKDMFPNVDEDDLLLALKESNFDLEEAISDILIKSSPFEHEGVVQWWCNNISLLILLNMLLSCYGLVKTNKKLPM